MRKRSTGLIVALALGAVGIGPVTRADGAWTTITKPTVNPSPQPFPRPYRSEIEPYAAYDGQTVCAKAPKSGVVAFERFVLRRFARASFGIKYSCAGGSISEHKEGRAIDWHMNAYDPKDRAAVKALFKMLFRPDWYGNPHAAARRLGIMYIIWNKKMWRAYRPHDGWQPYSGTSPHTDHVHISFARAGGLGLTSYWTGTVADLPGAWLPPVGPTPTPTPTATPTLPPTPSPSPTLVPLPTPPVPSSAT